MSMEEQDTAGSGGDNQATSHPAESVPFQGETPVGSNAASFRKEDAAQQKTDAGVEDSSSPLGRAAGTKVAGVPYRAAPAHIPQEDDSTGTSNANAVPPPLGGGVYGPPPGPAGSVPPPYPGMVWGYPYIAVEAAKKPWRKRHPVLFWGGIIILLLIAANVLTAALKGPLGGPKVAVVEVQGIIMDSDKVVAWIETIRKDSSVKSVVLRVNSPGGAVSPSQEMYAAVKRLSREKPVVVSMGALAASGGYYVSLGGKEIYANPSTLTASIGVKMQVPNLQGLMQTIGISEKTLATGALKDAGNVSREMTGPEQTYFQELITDMFEEFVQTVMRERNLSRDAVLAVADGRAMTGRQALKAGLVDHLGDYQDALERATVLGNFNAAPEVITGPVEEKHYLRDALGAVLELQQRQQAAATQPMFMY